MWSVLIATTVNISREHLTATFTAFALLSKVPGHFSAHRVNQYHCWRINTAPRWLIELLACIHACVWSELIATTDEVSREHLVATFTAFVY